MIHNNSTSKRYAKEKVPKKKNICDDYFSANINTIYAEIS